MYAELSLALPDLILAVSALVLLVWGAFAGKGGPLFTVVSVLALCPASVTA